MKYICGICGKIYDDYNTPIIEKDGVIGDGCCKIGSLIEFNAVLQSMIQSGAIKLSEYMKYMKDENLHHFEYRTIHISDPHNNVKNG